MTTGYSDQSSYDSMTWKEIHDDIMYICRGQDGGEMFAYYVLYRIETYSVNDGSVSQKLIRD